MQNNIELAGCTPTPLAAYLKGLGVLRLIAEQADPNAKGFWQNDVFVLKTEFSKQAITDFLANAYQPTPVIAPWNGGSGFFQKDNKTGVEAIISSESERFSKVRSAIDTARKVLRIEGLEEKPDGEKKTSLLRRLRSELDDHALKWLDAAVLLTEDNPRYPPLLGTGGNDGRLDFTNNYMQRLTEVFDLNSGKASDEAVSLLRSALFGTSAIGLKSAAIGQFSPGAAGGPNATTGFDAGSSINPWDFILMLEGAVLFAAASTRRLENADSGVLSYPFTVRPTGSGEGNTALSDESNARAEMWLPTWSTPVSIEELESLLSEGRVTLDRTPVRDSLDFIRAVARLGLERGIDAFHRYAFVMRSGKAYLATPLTRIQVTRNPAAQLIDQLESNHWLYRFRRLSRSKEAPARIQSLARRLEDALFDLARHGDSKHVQKVLILLGETQLYLKESPKSRENCPPVPVLSAEWVIKANDNSVEYQIARALAGLHSKKSQDGNYRLSLFMAEYFSPIQDGVKFRDWDEEAHNKVVWSRNALHENLYTVLRRRLIDAEYESIDDKPLSSHATAPLSAITAWLNNQIDLNRMTDLLTGLVLARIPFELAADEDRLPLIPAAYAILKPFFCTNDQLRRTKILAADRSLPLSLDFIARLWRGDNRVLESAQRRLNIAGCPLESGHIHLDGLDSRTLLAALMTPVSDRALYRLMSPLISDQKNKYQTILEKGEAT